MLEHAGKHCDDNNSTALAAVLNDNNEPLLLEFPSRYYTLSLHALSISLAAGLSFSKYLRMLCRYKPKFHGQTENCSVIFGISSYTLPTVLVDNRHTAPSHA